MALKKGDWIKLNYTGKTVEDNLVFDTTYPEVAKKNELDARGTFEPVTICIGEGQVLPGLEEALVGKDIGNHKLLLSPENAFGRKDAKLIQLVPMARFKAENINPVPGLQVNMDNHLGIVRRAGGGRVLVDFNHPLAGQDVEYEVSVEQVVTDKKEQVTSICKSMFGMEPKDVKVEGNKATITLPQELPKEIAEQLSKKWQEVLKLDKVEFAAANDEKEDKSVPTNE